LSIERGDREAGRSALARFLDVAPPERFAEARRQAREIVQRCVADCNPTD
jgi:hypothetical protein